MVFGAVIFSLLAQGLTISPLLRWLRLAEGDSNLGEHERVQGKLLAETAAIADLDSMRNRGTVVEPLYRKMRGDMERSQQELSARLVELDSEGVVLEMQERRLRQHLLSEKKARLALLLREGLLSEEAHQELNGKLDHDLANLKA